jgi:hypothetical protein
MLEDLKPGFLKFPGLIYFVSVTLFLPGVDLYWSIKKLNQNTLFSQVATM